MRASAVKLKARELEQASQYKSDFLANRVVTDKRGRHTTRSGTGHP